MRNLKYVTLLCTLLLYACGSDSNDVGGSNGSSSGNVGNGNVGNGNIGSGNSEVGNISANSDRSGQPFYPAGLVLDDAGNSLPLVRRNYLLEFGGQSSLTVDIDADSSITLVSPQLSVTDNSENDTRTTRMSGPVELMFGGEPAMGNYDFESTETFSRTVDGNISLASLRLITTVDFRELTRTEIKIDLTLTSDDSTTDFLQRNDLQDLVGTTTQIDGSAGDIRGQIFENHEDFDTAVTNVSERFPAAPIFFTVQEFLDEFTVNGKRYQRVAVVESLANQLNPLTNQLEPVTTTFYLAQGIGIIKANNLTSFYGQPLNWELVSIE